jgi:KaiC/GvpD/RAD55 family RecA-like ATPase
MADLQIGKTNVTQLLLKKYKLLGTGWISLIGVPSKQHMAINKESMKILVNELGYKCIYITLSKSCADLQKLYKAYGIDTNSVFFIDAISRMYGEAGKDSARCTYVSGPLDIDSITSSLHEVFAKLSKEKICVFLDSVTTVLLYNSLSRTLRFSKFLTKTLKDIGVDGIMVSITKGKGTAKLIMELQKLCDEVIDIKE